MSHVRSPRGVGATGWLSPREVVAFSAKVRELLAAEPELLHVELVRRSGAPSQLVTRVRARFLAAREVMP